jgi:hypothetical protein
MAEMAKKGVLAKKNAQMLADMQNILYLCTRNE